MPNPKIAFIGNMNNNHFAMVRYLRDEGFEVDLLLLNTELTHFLPEADSIDTDYLAYTRQLEWGCIDSFLSTPSSVIERDLEKYTHLVGTNSAPAFVNKAGRKLSIFDPHGADIWSMTRPAVSRRPLRTLASFLFTKAQRRGIREARFLHACEQSPEYEARIRKLTGPSTKRIWHPFPMVYAPTYHDDPCDNFQSIPPLFKKLRSERSFICISCARHEWSFRGAPITKGTDILLHGFKKFVKHNPTACLIVFEYGHDVHLSKEYAFNNGLENNVFFLPKLSRKKIMGCLAMADAAFGQFSTSWITNGVLIEALVAGAPIISHRSNAHTKVSGLYPILNSATATDIKESLTRLTNNGALKNRLKTEGKTWYTSLVEKNIKAYSDIFK